MHLNNITHRNRCNSPSHLVQLHQHQGLQSVKVEDLTSLHHSVVSLVVDPEVPQLMALLQLAQLLLLVNIITVENITE